MRQAEIRWLCDPVTTNVATNPIFKLKNKTMKITTTLFAAAALLLPITAQAESAEKAKPTVVEIAVGNENFSTLVAAVKAAGLAEALSGEGPFTIFAPTNDAFAKLPAGTVESLLKLRTRTSLLLSSSITSSRVR